MSELSPFTKRKKHSLLQVLLFTGFLANVAGAVTLFINSSFLKTFLPEQYVGLVFTVAYGVAFVYMQIYSLLLTILINLCMTLFLSLISTLY